MKKFLIVAIIYLFLTLILTFPLVLHLGQGIIGGGGPGDQLFNIWVLSWDNHAFLNPSEHFFDANIFYPVKNSLLGSEYFPGIFLFAWPLFHIFHNPVLVYNLLLIMAIFLSGLTMYFLVYYFTKNHLASFFAGFVYTFSPFRLADLNHLQLAFSFFLPLVILFLDRYLKKGKTLDLSFFSLCFVLQFLVSSYLAYYVFFLVFFYCLGYFIWFRKFMFFRTLIKLVLALILCFAIIYPFYRPYFKAEIRPERPLEVVQLSAPTPIDFLSMGESLIFRTLAKEGIALHPQADGVKLLFIGFIGPLLALIGLLTYHDRRKWIFLLLIVFCFWLTLGPYYRGVKMIYWYLYHYFYPFRAQNFPYRTLHLLIVPLAILVGFGISYILKNKKISTILLLIPISILIFIESYYLPLSYTKLPSKENFAPVYHWLASQPGDFGIIEVPVTQEIAINYQMYYSTLHWKKLAMGFTTIFPGSSVSLWDSLKKFPSPESIEAIQNTPDKYLIIHLDQFSDERVLSDFLAKNKPVAKFENDYVYEITTIK